MYMKYRMYEIGGFIVMSKQSATNYVLYGISTIYELLCEYLCCGRPLGTLQLDSFFPNKITIYNSFYLILYLLQL
jgi:hypothetical protein